MEWDTLFQTSQATWFQLLLGLGGGKSSTKFGTSTPYARDPMFLDKIHPQFMNLK
jgi:hypothetical protein